MRLTRLSSRSFGAFAFASALLASSGVAREASAVTPCDCALSPTAIQIDVWLDPGHDPQHTGNLGLNLSGAFPNEEHVTWDITNDLSSVLLNSGYCALLTRVNFNSVYGPTQRSCIASGRMMNDNGDRAFGQALVSIHTNSGPPAVYGTSTVYPSVKTCGAHADQFLGDQGFANDLQAAMLPQMALAYTGACSGGLPCNSNKGICPSNTPCSQGHKDAIEKARIPAVIVEVGYQTNPCQECAMRIQHGVIANAVAAGIFNTFITPTFCASANGLAGAGSTAALSKSRVPAPALPEARRRPPAKQAAPAQVLSFSEGFEGATFPPSGWSIQSGGAPPAFAWARTTSTYYVATGTGAAFDGGGWTSSKDELLISPAVALGVGDTGLRFSWVGNRVFASEVDAQVLARPSGGGSWTTLWSLSSQPYGDAFVVKTETVSLSAFAGQTIELAFRATGTAGADFSVDDVEVGAFQVSQPPANDLCANAAQLPSGNFNLLGTTCRATNDMDPGGSAGACIGYEMDGPDVFYHFTVGAGDSLTASVHGQWGPGLYVMNSCSGTPTDCVAGAYFEDSDLDPTITVVFAQAGQYVLAVDGSASGCGDFQISGRLHGPTVGVGPQPEGTPGLQVAPNPMTSQTMVAGAFRHAVDGRAKLTITDVQGRRVMQRDLSLNRGRVAWAWNRRDAAGRRVAPGVYVVVVEAQDGKEALRARVIVRN